MDIQRSMLWAMSARDSRSPRGGLRLVDEDGVAAEGVDGGLEGEAGAEGGLLEEHDHLARVEGVAEVFGLALTAWASSMMAAISSTVRSAMEQRSRPLRRFDASLKAVSDWMPRVAVGLVAGSSSSFALVFMTTVLLPMGLLSCRRCAGVCCADDFVHCFDGCLDVFAFEDEWGKETKNCSRWSG